MAATTTQAREAREFATTYATTPTADRGVSQAGAELEQIELPLTQLARSGGPALEQALGGVPGMRKVHVNVQSAQAYLGYDPDLVTVGQLA